MEKIGAEETKRRQEIEVDPPSGKEPVPSLKALIDNFAHTLKSHLSDVFGRTYGNPVEDQVESYQMSPSHLTQVLFPTDGCKCQCSGSTDCKCKKPCDCDTKICLCVCDKCECWKTKRGWCNPRSLEHFEMACDVLKLSDRYEIKINLPGFPKERIDVTTIHGEPMNVLQVTASCTFSAVEKAAFLRKERPFGLVTRRFSLPLDAHVADIQCEFRNGVLTATLPRVESEKNKSSIRIA